MANQATPPALASYDVIFPAFGELTRNVLQPNTWQKKNSKLTLRERELLTLAVLVITGRNDQLRNHIVKALERDGFTRDELGEVFQHLAFYGGWPGAVNAFNLAKQVYEAQDAAAKAKQPGRAAAKKK